MSDMTPDDGREAITDPSAVAADLQMRAVLKRPGNPLDPTGDEVAGADDIDWSALTPPTRAEELLASIADPWPHIQSTPSTAVAPTGALALRYGPVPSGEQWVFERLAVVGVSAGAIAWDLLVAAGTPSTVDGMDRALLDAGELTGASRARAVAADGASSIVVRTGDCLTIMAVGPGAGDQLSAFAQIRVEKAAS